MKNGETHELPLSKQALAILANRRPANAKPDALVFPSGEGKPYDACNDSSPASAKRSSKDSGATAVLAFTTFAGRSRRFSRSDSTRILST